MSGSQSKLTPLLVATRLDSGCWICVGAAAFTAFNLSACPDPNFGALHHHARYTWSGGFPGVLTGSFFFVGGLTIVPAAVGVNPRFFMLDVFGLVLALITGMLLGNHLMWLQWRQYVREHSPAEVERESGNDEEDGADEDTIRGAADSICSAMGNTLLIVVFTLGYPIAILPYYRAESTSDWERFAIVCVVHPLAQEFIMTTNRQKRRSEVEGWQLLSDDNSFTLALQMMNVTCEWP